MVVFCNRTCHVIPGTLLDACVGDGCCYLEGFDLAFCDTDDSTKPHAEDGKTGTRKVLREETLSVDLRRIFGNQGEQHAEQYLVKNGYRILARQFRTRFGEIDLVAQQGNEIVFVEVKTRRSTAHGFPEDAVTPTKLTRLARAAERFLKERTLEASPYRFDVIAIVMKEDGVDLEHLVGV